MIMTCEIYPRLKRLQEKYNEVCSFKYDEFGKPFIETHSSLQPGSEGWHKLFVEFHNKNLTRVIKSLEHSIKCYLDMDYEIKHDTLEQQREDRTAMALIGWNFWSLGLQITFKY